jgi:hypothetical protein
VATTLFVMPPNSENEWWTNSEEMNDRRFSKSFRSPTDRHVHVGTTST